MKKDAYMCKEKAEIQNVRERLSGCLSVVAREEEIVRETLIVCLFKSATMSLYDDRTNGLLCHAWPWKTSMDLGLHQSVLEAACLPLSTPPTSQTAGSTTSPTGQVPLNSRGLWSDRQKKGVWEGFGNYKLCLWVWWGSRLKARGMVRVRWGQRPVPISTVLLFVGCGLLSHTLKRTDKHVLTNM